MGGDPEPLIRLPTPVRAALEEKLDTHDPAPVRIGIHQAALDEFGYVHHLAMEPWISRAEAWIVATGEPGKVLGKLLLADWLG